MQTTQDLQRRARFEGLYWQSRIYERTATADHNQTSYELSKAALYGGLIHLAKYDLARAELEGLVLKGEKVVAPSSGSVTTKDSAEAIANVVWTLLHERSEEIYASLSGLSPRASQPGGIPLLGTPHQQLPDFDLRRRHARTQAAVRKIR